MLFRSVSQSRYPNHYAVYLYMSYTKSKIYHDVSSNRIMIGERELKTSDLANIQRLYKIRTGVRLTIEDIKYEVNKIADENQVSLANTHGSPKRINGKPVRDALFKVTRQEHADDGIVFMSLTLYALSRELGCDVDELKEHINVIRAHLINLGFVQRWESSELGAEARELYYKRGHTPDGAYSHSTPIPRG